MSHYITSASPSPRMWARPRKPRLLASPGPVWEGGRFQNMLRSPGSWILLASINRQNIFPFTSASARLYLQCLMCNSARYGRIMFYSPKASRRETITCHHWKPLRGTQVITAAVLLPDHSQCWAFYVLRRENICNTLPVTAKPQM